jgi:hypothetical protein
MESPIFIFIGIVVVLIIIITQIFSKKAIVKRKLKKTPSKKINEFKDGDVAKLVGKVDCIHTVLTAPLSGRKCAYYFVKIEREVSSGKSGSHWEKLIEEEIYDDFLVRDDSGIALINTVNIRSYIVFDAKYRSGFLDDATEDLELYLRKHGHESVNFLGFNKTLRYREAVLEIGEEISIVGKGYWKENSLNEKLLEIKQYDGFPVYLSDDQDTLDFVKEKPETEHLKPQFHSFEKLQESINRNERSRYKKSYRNKRN